MLSNRVTFDDPNSVKNLLNNISGIDNNLATKYFDTSHLIFKVKSDEQELSLDPVQFIESYQNIIKTNTNEDILEMTDTYISSIDLSTLLMTKCLKRFFLISCKIVFETHLENPELLNSSLNGKVNGCVT